MHTITNTILAQIGGDEFLKIGTAKEYRFTPLTACVDYPSLGLRLQVGKNQAIMLIIYDEGADEYIFQAGKNCKNVGKVYKGVYYDQLISLIETEADEEFPSLKCPEEYDEVTITNW